MPRQEILPHLPIIVAGLSGAGKSVISLRHELQHDIPPHQQSSLLPKFFSRRPRPGEVEGVDGLFGHDPEELQKMTDLLLYYEKNGESYAVTRTPVIETLQKRHLTIIGGETDTSTALKYVIGNDRSPVLCQMLQAITVFIRRPLEDILRSLDERPADEEEKHRRKTRVQQVWDTTDPQTCDYIIDNRQGAIDDSVHQMTEIINHELIQQLRNRFGNDYKMEDYANAHL